MESPAMKSPIVQRTASTWRWTCGMIYIVMVALIWITASFVVQSVVDGGVSPFLITYICSSLFIVYIPIVEVGRFLERTIQQCGLVRNVVKADIVTKLSQQAKSSENETLLEPIQAGNGSSGSLVPIKKEFSDNFEVTQKEGVRDVEDNSLLTEDYEVQDQRDLDSSGFAECPFLDEDGKKEVAVIASDDARWTKKRTALVALTICPFWFFAQLTFNFSLKYTTVTSNTILSTTSSLFTFLISLRYLGERFTWLKLASVCFCMAGTILVGLGDSWSGDHRIALNPFLGDVICLLSAFTYAIYTAILRAKVPDEEDEGGKVSMALIFGYIGLFNALLFGPVTLLLHFTGVEPFHRLTRKQFGLIIGKGLLDNVLSDYLWAKAVLLTTPTAATAGLTIQVPIAAVVDSFRGVVPSSMDILGAFAVLIGFSGINMSKKVVIDPVTGSASA